MKVGSGGNLRLSRNYSQKPFGPMFYSWCNCPFSMSSIRTTPILNQSPMNEAFSLLFDHNGKPVESSTQLGGKVSYLFFGC